MVIFNPYDDDDCSHVLSLELDCHQVSLISCRNIATSLGLFHKSVGVNVVGLLGQLKR